MKKLSLDPKNYFRVLASTQRSQVAEMVLESGQSTGGTSNVHHSADQWLYVTSGHGEAIIKGKKVEIKEGDLLLIEAGEPHEIINSGSKPLATFNIYAPCEY